MPLEACELREGRDDPDGKSRRIAQDLAPRLIFLPLLFIEQTTLVSLICRPASFNGPPPPFASANSRARSRLHPLPQAWRLRFRSALNAPPPHHRRLPPAAPLPLSPPPRAREKGGRRTFLISYCVLTCHTCAHASAPTETAARRDQQYRASGSFVFAPRPDPAVGDGSCAVQIIRDPACTHHLHSRCVHYTRSRYAR